MLVTPKVRLVYENEAGRRAELSPFSVFCLRKCEEELENTIHTEKQAGIDGEQFIGSDFGARTIILSGSIRTRNYESASRELVRVFNPALSGRLIYQHADAAKDKMVECRVERVPFTAWSSGALLFEIELTACVPFWAEQERTEYLALLTKNLTWPLIIPSGGMSFGLRRPALESAVENTGDVESGFRVIFKAVGGTVINPEISDKAAGDVIRINITLQKGDTLEVVNYPELKRVLLNGEDAMRNLDIQSEFFTLKVGTNRIGYRAGENTVNLDVILSYTPRYLGVG